ncbi:MAG: flavodoxin-dependent (E)-4-hydroxy-3-methylbut-2-enyl-diphosphate synthase, partial [Clostridia bacterium]|nr:flavodoxin-dependent (E)-4-hydroxy-3-methylbut-2-enyl-diphosphate synthase [Clostridia bacterium]
MEDTKLTKQVQVGNVCIGGGAPISVQTMTNTDTRDVPRTLQQIQNMARAGADIVRVSVYDEQCADAVRTLVDQSPVPLVADIHFDVHLAIRSIENGIAKVRINP